jgi:hypothetical protein
MELNNINPNGMTNGESHSKGNEILRGLMDDLKSQLSRFPEDATLIKQIVDSAMNENELNDHE